MKTQLHLGFICVFLLLFVSQVSESRSGTSNVKSDDGGRQDDSTCSTIGNRCLCRRPRRKEQSLICFREDCMDRLPTDEIPDEQVNDVVSLLVTKQHNLTRIGTHELRRLGNIRHIRIFRCRIKEVEPNAFIGLNYVERLDLHRNNLSAVPNAIKYLTNLKSLNLGGNHIKFVKNDAFYSNSHLERLVLGRNFITRLPTLLPSSLIKLSINKNGLESLDGVMRLTSLRTLNAAGNKLRMLPDLPKSLRVINFCSNLINQTVSLAGLPNLKVAILNNNPNLGHISLTTFYDVDSRSSAFKLVTFEARNSGVSNVDSDAFSCLPRLQNIDLAENSITDYSEMWFAANKGLRRIWLHGNYFKCDCDIAASLREIAEVFTERRNRKASISENFDDVFTNDFDNVSCSNEDLRPCENFKFRPDYCFKEAHPTTTKTTRTTSKMTKSTTSIEPSTTTRTTTISSTTTESSPKTTTMTASTSTTSTTTSSATTQSKPATTTITTTKPATATSTTTTSTNKPAITTTSTATTSKAEPAESSSSISSLFAESKRQSSTPGKLVLPPIRDVQKDTTTTTTTSIATSSTTTTTTTTTEGVEEERCLQSGGKCHFPFTYQGEIHTKCIPAFTFSWCSKTEDYDTDGKWDYCVNC